MVNIADESVGRRKTEVIGYNETNMFTARRLTRLFSTGRKQFKYQEIIKLGFTL